MGRDEGADCIYNYSVAGMYVRTGEAAQRRATDKALPALTPALMSRGRLARIKGRGLRRALAHSRRRPHRPKDSMFEVDTTPPVISG